MNIESRRIGKSDLHIAPLAFGGNVFGWTADEKRSFELLDAFVDAGLNLVDTADIYSTWVPGHQGGESETILGKWIAASGKRAKVILATKAGKPMGADKKGLSRKYLFSAIEDSLRRLQTDYIDLYQSHEDDPDTPQEETLAAFGELMKQGKVRAIGASNYSAERLQQSLEVSRANGLPRYECLQPNYNLYDRAGYEEKLEPLCRREDIGVIPYFSLASGFLSGKYRSASDASGRARSSMVAKYFNPRGDRILNALDSVAARVNSKPAPVALAWLMARPGITAPIASATDSAQLAELIKAVHLRLDNDSLRELDEASAY